MRRPGPGILLSCRPGGKLHSNGSDETMGELGMFHGDVLDSYDRAWNETDADARRRLLEASLTDTCELVEPRGRFVGREAIIDRVSGFSQRVPGARVNITTKVDEHNGFARYGWAIVDQNGAQVLEEGMDVIELAEDGRLGRIVMFFGPLRPL